MFNWWTKKLKKERIEPIAPKTHTIPVVKLHLSSSDTMHERAGKIWRLLGFVNDRFGSVNALASYLYAYKEVDEMAREGERISEQTDNDHSEIIEPGDSK